MQTPNPFTIYNASAGSGKTFTLVKEYLKILFASKNQSYFKNILAITFTNKAVAEMKERIIEKLKTFSSKTVLENGDSMFNALCEELGIQPNILHEKSKRVLNTIVHNYAAFDISTIDRFTHKIIRTFAYDLKLSLNFEVELDQDSLINEAVDSLIAKAGTDKALTKILVDFAIEKADDDKSWDVSFDFNKMAKLLINENDIPFIETLKKKTLEDFKTLKAQLRKDILLTESKIVETAEGALKLISHNGLEFSDFSRSTLPNHFKKASELNLDGLYNNQLETNISENNGVYTTKLDTEKKNTIDAILPQIGTLYRQTKQAVFYLKFLKNFYKNITPLSVLNAIQKELTSLKEAQNKMLISEFNTIISNEIKNQPTPFIYERIGEKFKHYFIDEFQDTSELQWQNLIPLLDNALSAERGTAMLVGDAKQAIYRWRGGKADQFIDLFNKKVEPFQIKQEIKSLDNNFRSCPEIINFNNAFFSYLAHQVFSQKDYESLYEQAKQKVSKNEGGYVELSFLNFEKDDDRDVLYPKKVLEIINKCLDNGFVLEDICVLTRKKKEGVAIANFLSQQGINIMSSETLLIHSSPQVNFINNLLTLIVQPKNDDVKIKVLSYLASLLGVENKHAFFSQHIFLTLSQFFKSLEAFDIFIDNNTLLQSPLYDTAECIARQFGLTKTSNAYIQFYFDIVLEYSYKKGTDLAGFLEYFEKKKETLSIVSPNGQKAVQIMTLHKSKGLEFPVVIFPYADLDIYDEREPKAWYPLNPKNYNGFRETLLNFNRDFENYGSDGLQIYNRHLSELELDNINLLYVALTRPIEQLYVVSKKDMSSKGEVFDKKYSGLFINYLKQQGLWDELKSTYSFGGLKPIKPRHEVSNNASLEDNLINYPFISTAKEQHQINIVTNSGYLWDSLQQEAIEKGNLIHDIMAGIKTKDDIDFVINGFVQKSLIDRKQALLLKKKVLEIVNHPMIEAYFSNNFRVYNEREIISKTGIILRPDRIVINSENEAVIIDYKSGHEDKKHMQQLQTYQDILEEMSISVTNKILVYTNETVSVKMI